MRILGIDPGPEQSAFVVWENKPVEWEVLPNHELIERIRENHFGGINRMAVEMIASYGMPVGAEVFNTCIWIGRFLERAKVPCHLVLRRDIKLHLCNSAIAKDANVRQALIDRFGPPGKKASPGLLYGISGHTWAAVAVAVYASDHINAVYASDHINGASS